ncbi:Uncharacterised protein [Pantoea agglomerans]|uniref:Uncharacterized protein n=1 Tax=Enterobacter agglomerans TaxID=549 RepID=A0A379AG23_ENTAG|nr:Uncharacterised protein [Pantoea agglomerans]
MTLGVIVAAIAGSAFAGNEVGYIVSMGSTATMAMVIYFAICFGKITFTTLNAYGSFMSLTTIVSGFRQQTTLSRGRAHSVCGAYGYAGLRHCSAQ